jgi:hypothetical protein
LGIIIIIIDPAFAATETGRTARAAVLNLRTDKVAYRSSGRYRRKRNDAPATKGTVRRR